MCTDPHPRNFADVAMQDNVDQLFSLPNREAVNLVIINARQGLKKVKTFNDSTDPLQSSHGLTVSENLEAGLRNASIKFLSNVVCKVGGGTASWLAVTAYFPLVSGQSPTHSPIWIINHP